MNKRFVIVLVVVAVLIAGCGPGNAPSGIGRSPGIGRGTISNLDPLNNGLFQIWIFGDNTYVYCTSDSALAQKVKSIMMTPGDNTVVYTYRDWKTGDPEYDSLDRDRNQLSSSCGQFVKGSSGSKLLTVDLVSTLPR